MQPDTAIPDDPTTVTWKDVLHAEKEKEYFKTILSTIERERAAGKIIYPKNSEIFKALHLTELADVKAVILGQDPYHGPGQAHGLCFSVQPGIKPPPSLNNIFSELESDLGLTRPSSGSLEPWARAGVLLLNAVLSVQAGNAGSHARLNWERFTDQVIAELNRRREHVVFLLWGAYAQKKGAMIDPGKHCVLKAPHPSPLSAHRGFLGCKHFSRANEYLTAHGIAPINWTL